MRAATIASSVLLVVLAAACLLLSACGGAASSGPSPRSSGGPAPAPGGGGTPTNPGPGTPSGAGSPVMYISETAQAPASTTTSGWIDARAIDLNSGALSPLPGSPFPTNHPQVGDMALSVDGKFAYLLVEDFPGNCCVGPWSVVAYALDPASGAPAEKQTLAINSSQPAGILVHPAGKFVYIASDNEGANGGSGIEVFSVQGDGTLASAGFSPAQTDGGTTVLDPNGKFLYTTSFGAPVGNWENTAACGPIQQSIWTFRIDAATGVPALASAAPAVFQRDICNVGKGPDGVILQIDPSGQQLFVVDLGNRDLVVLAIDPSSGAPALLPGTTPVSIGASSAAMDPKDRFFYLGSIDYSFTGFSLNSASGVLSVLPGMPVQVVLHSAFNEGSRTMAVDPSGTFLFSNENDFTSAFSCCEADDLLGFRIDPGTGALTHLGTLAPLAGSASKIVISPPH